MGDVLLARNVEFLMNSKNPSYPFDGFDFEDISLNPYVIGNFEASVPEKHVPTKPQMIDFSVDVRYLLNAREAGFTNFSLANNHSFDSGAAGYSNTIDALTDSGITPFGNPKHFNSSSIDYLSLPEIDVAIIALHALESEPSALKIKHILSTATKRSDYQIVYVHWGIEYDLESSDSQKKLAEKLVEAGADLIVGHHPHVVQEIDYIQDVPIFYSLGNYIFDQYFSSEVQEGLVLHLDFSSEPAITIIPVTSELSLSQPTYMTPDKHHDFLRDLAKRSASTLRENIVTGVIPMNIPVASSPKMAMMDL